MFSVVYHSSMVEPLDPTSDALTLCCGRKNACPTITHSPTGFRLVDDDGQAVSLSSEQARMMADWILGRPILPE